MDKIWEDIHANYQWGAYPPEHVIRFVARNYYMLERKSIRILDFGCGQGANTWYLAREGFDTYAFDGSESAVLKCRQKMIDEGLYADLRVMDGISIDYEDNYFDAVIDNACIYANDLKNIKKMYSGVIRVLKPGGKFMTSCFGEELGGYRTGTEIEPGTFIDIKSGVLAERGMSHIFTENELIDILQQIGFVVLQCDWIRYKDCGNIVHQIICVAEKED